MQSLTDELEVAKVCLTLELTGASPDSSVPQREKEALDDASTELELADEDQLVMCAPIVLTVPIGPAIDHSLSQIPRRGSICVSSPGISSAASRQ
jgi:hypothetical protein